MPQRYFELTDDMTRPERWLLGDPLDEQGQRLRARRFLSGEALAAVGHARVPIHHPGTPLDFSTTDTGGIPVVTAKVAGVLFQLAPQDIQLHPAEVDTRPEPYFLVNALRLVKCIDDEACAEVTYWQPEDERPDKLGQYRDVHGLRIDAARVGTAQVLRPWGYPSALLVSEDIKDALEHLGATGLDFREVTGPGALSEEARAYKRQCNALLDPPAAARNTFWHTLGTVDALASTPRAIAPTWPAHREDWCVIHRDAGHTLLVSHGLSDPFLSCMEPSVGLGLELALETDVSLPPIAESWPFRLLARVTREVLGDGPLREQLLLGPCALEVSAQDLPRALSTPEGRVGVLLGMTPRSLPTRFTTPFGDVRLVPLKPLLPSEVRYLREHAREAPTELARRFLQSAEEHRASVRRPPVV